MRAFVVGQPQRAGQRIEHLRRRIRRQALLQSRVVGQGHTGQLGQLLAPEAGNPSSSVDGQIHVFDAHRGTSGPEEAGQQNILLHVRFMSRAERTCSRTPSTVNVLSAVKARFSAVEATPSRCSAGTTQQDHLDAELLGVLDRLGQVVVAVHQVVDLGDAALGIADAGEPVATILQQTRSSVATHRRRGPGARIPRCGFPCQQPEPKTSIQALTPTFL